MFTFKKEITQPTIQEIIDSFQYYDENIDVKLIDNKICGSWDYLGNFIIETTPADDNDKMRMFINDEVHEEYINDKQLTNIIDHIFDTKRFHATQDAMALEYAEHGDNDFEDLAEIVKLIDENNKTEIRIDSEHTFYVLFHLKILTVRIERIISEDEVQITTTDRKQLMNISFDDLFYHLNDVFAKIRHDIKNNTFYTIIDDDIEEVVLSPYDFEIDITRDFEKDKPFNNLTISFFNEDSRHGVLVKDSTPIEIRPNNLYSSKVVAEFELELQELLDIDSIERLIAIATTCEKNDTRKIETIYRKVSTFGLNTDLFDKNLKF